MGQRRVREAYWRYKWYDMRAKVLRKMVRKQRRRGVGAGAWVGMMWRRVRRVVCVRLG